ncbi:hypothetical protein [Nannocystis pusilla]|uniref:hypothetical protein n=1 Tax=Nannocystis pusilla TaxID=889268 RepID=UPI003DA5B4FC
MARPAAGRLPRSLASTLAFAALAATTVGCGKGIYYEFTEGFKYVEPFDHIDLDVDRGSLTFVAWPRPDATMKRHTSGFDKEFGPAEAGVDDGVLVITAACKTDDRCWYDHMLEFSTGVSVALRMQLGYVEIGYVDRELTAELDEGGFHGVQLAGPVVEVSLGTGDIDVRAGRPARARHPAIDRRRHRARRPRRQLPLPARRAGGSGRHRRHLRPRRRRRPRRHRRRRRAHRHRRLTMPARRPLGLALALPLLLGLGFKPGTCGSILDYNEIDIVLEPVAALHVTNERGTVKTITFARNGVRIWEHVFGFQVSLGRQEHWVEDDTLFAHFDCRLETECLDDMNFELPVGTAIELERRRGRRRHRRP